MTGPELLAALERLTARLRRAWPITERAFSEFERDVDAELDHLTPEAIAQLRALIRTPEETEALRAALRWWTYAKAGGDNLEAVGRHQNMVAALDAIPDARREQIMQEGKRDG